MCWRWPGTDGDPRNNYAILTSGGHHRTPSGGLPTSLTGVSAGYLGMGINGMGGIHAAQAYGMATPRLMQARMRTSKLFMYAVVLFNPVYQCLLPNLKGGFAFFLRCVFAGKGEGSGKRAAALLVPRDRVIPYTLCVCCVWCACVCVVAMVRACTRPLQRGLRCLGPLNVYHSKCHV